jgi:hypothetical protein
MSMFGFGSYGARYDEDLPSKIARFKDRHKSQADKYEEFLKFDLGVDPKDIPMTVEDAQNALNNALSKYGADEFRLTGNSLQLVRVEYNDGDAVDRDTVDWDMFVKAHTALVAAPYKGVYSFIVRYGEINPVIPFKIDEQPFSYPVGTLLRISNGTNSAYVRVGSFSSDTELLNSETFEAVADPETYKVIEVIE